MLRALGVSCYAIHMNTAEVTQGPIDANVNVLMTCCNRRYATVAQTIDHKCDPAVTTAEVKARTKTIAKAYKVDRAGWHIFIAGQYNFYSKKSFKQLVKAIGRPVVDVCGNGIYFD